MYAIAAYGVQCLVDGCRGQVQGSRLCVQEEGCCSSWFLFASVQGPPHPPKKYVIPFQVYRVILFQVIRYGMHHRAHNSAYNPQVKHPRCAEFSKI